MKPGAVHTSRATGGRHGPGQTAQRVKVGVVGLALVLMLIGLASLVFSAARGDRPLAAEGGGHAEVVANIADGNDADAANEPLADLGVAPGAAAEEPGRAPQPSPTTAPRR